MNPLDGSVKYSGVVLCIVIEYCYCTHWHLSLIELDLKEKKYNLHTHYIMAVYNRLYIYIYLPNSLWAE